MPVSEAKKKANKKWEKKNIKAFTVSLYKKEYELLDNYCKENNISKNKFIKSRIADIINTSED